MTNETNDSHHLTTSMSFYLTKSGSYIADVNTTNSGPNKTTHTYGSYGRESVKNSNPDLSHNETKLNTVDSRNTSGFTKTHNGVYVNTKKSSKKISKYVYRNGESIQSLSTEDEEKKKDKHRKLKFSEMPRRSKYALLIIAMANFGAGCGFSLPAPFFPREAQLKQASPTAIGLVFSSYQLVNFIACPIFGNFLTRIGAKFLYVSGILVSGTCAILFGFLDQCPPGDTFVAMSFIVRSVEALGVSAFSTASFAIVSNEFPNHISSVFATLETCIGIGLMTGPTIGGALYEVGGFGLPFWVIGAVICISGLMVFTCLPPPEDNTLKRKGSIFCLLKSLLVWVTILSLLAGAIGISFMDPTLSDHLDQFGISTLVVGLFFVIAPGLHALMAPVWGYFSDTKDIQSPLLIIGNVVGAIGYLFIGPTPLLPFLPRELWTVTVGLVLFGFTVGCSIVPTMKLFVIGARELGLPDSLNTYGLVSGLFNSMFCLGAFIGPTIGGALVEQIGFYYGSTLISGFYLFVMIITAIFFGLRRLRKQRLENLETGLTGHVESSLHRTLGQQDNSVCLTDRQADERGHQADERSPLLSNSTHIKSFETSFSSTSYSR